MSLYEWSMEEGSESITFKTASGRVFEMRYDQDCCASCSVVDVIGDFVDLLLTPLLMAEDVSSDDSWTFIKFGTVKGYVTIRWYGSSNGYYSESPTFYELTQQRRNAA